METDAQEMSTIQPRIRRRSVLEEEIEIRPSPELIPDEYEHPESESVSFHIFRTETDLEVELSEYLFETVKGIGYQVETEKNIHQLNKSDEFITDLESIKKNSSKKCALVLVFIGFTGNSDGTFLLLDEPAEKDSCSMKSVWNFFASNNCPEFKNKPKIFIFCMSPYTVHAVQTDTMKRRAENFDKRYDFPVESDMLIVYKKSNDPVPTTNEAFLTGLSNNIAKHSKKYDIIDLVSYNHKQKLCPLLISTLTRKFYLTPNEEREQFLSLIEKSNSLEITLQKIQNDIQKLHEAQKRKKDKRFRFSFRMKSEDKPKIRERKDTQTGAQPRTSKDSAKRTTPLSPPSLDRSRPSSESEPALGNKKPPTKPIWRN